MVGPPSDHAEVWRTRCAELNHIEAHHHVVVFVFEVMAVHQIAPPIAVESHDDADIVSPESSRKVSFQPRSQSRGA